MKNEKRSSRDFAFNICVFCVLPRVELYTRQWRIFRRRGAPVRPPTRCLEFSHFPATIFPSWVFVSFAVAGAHSKTPWRFAFYLQAVFRRRERLQRRRRRRTRMWCFGVSFQWARGMILCFNICCYFSLSSRGEKSPLSYSTWGKTPVSNFVDSCIRDF